MITADHIDNVRKAAHQLLTHHSVGTGKAQPADIEFSRVGDFNLHREQQDPDLYGMIDAVYILYTLGDLAQVTQRTGRRQWADKILACQDDEGWFSRLNHRGHSREHATAYAIGALTLLAVEADEEYLSAVRPLTGMLPLLTDPAAFTKWIEHLNFRGTIHDIRTKNVGWHHIWRSSHIGGGIPAALGMMGEHVDLWWSGRVDLNAWFERYFQWLDDHANPRTGYWQRAFWNKVYRSPTLIDMGGAVHFYWVYAARARPLPYPAKIIDATLTLQKPTGLYRQHPYCIDLDGNFCINRAYLQLDSARQQTYREQVYASATANFEAIVTALTARPTDEIYQDSHGLPGALAALTECAKLPDFPYADLMANWQHPLDNAWWL